MVFPDRRGILTGLLRGTSTGGSASRRVCRDAGTNHRTVLWWSTYNQTMRIISALFRIAAALIVCSLIGCSTVTTVHPFGQPIATDLSAELTGTWIGAEGNQLQIHCTREGLLTYAVTEWKEDQEAFVLESGDGVLTAIGDRIFFNDLEEGEDSPSAYSFVLLRVMAGQLVVWLPNVDEFRSLVESATLEGMIEEEEHSANVVLTGSSETITNALESLDLARLFDWSEPAIVLVRLKKTE